MTHEPGAEPKSIFLMLSRAPTPATLFEPGLKKAQDWDTYLKSSWKAGDTFDILSRSAGNSQVQCSTPDFQIAQLPYPHPPGVSLFGHRQAAVGTGAHYKILLSLTQCSQR